MNTNLSQLPSMISHFAVCLIVASLLSSGAYSEDLAVNGGFETGDVSAWESFPSSSSTFTAESDSPFFGSFNGKLENTAEASAAVIKQANLGVGTVTAGQEITISFLARGSGLVGGVHFAELFSEVAGGGVSKAEILGGAPLFPSSATDWTPYSFDTTLGPDVSGGVTLQFAATTGAAAGSASTLEIDNVSVTVASAVPEPSSLALLGLGSVAMLFRRRR